MSQTILPLSPLFSGVFSADLHRTEYNYFTAAADQLDECASPEAMRQLHAQFPRRHYRPIGTSGALFQQPDSGDVCCGLHYELTTAGKLTITTLAGSDILVLYPQRGSFFNCYFELSTRKAKGMYGEGGERIFVFKPLGGDEATRYFTNLRRTHEPRRRLWAAIFG